MIETLYKEQQERLAYLEAQEQTEEIEIRIKELTLAIVRIQQMILAEKEDKENFKKLKRKLLGSSGPLTKNLNI